MVNIAVMGHGVVGSGVVEVFYKNKASIEKKAGTQMDIKYILDLRDFPELSYHDKFIKDFEKIIADDSIKVVVEVMGGIHPAYDYAVRCLKNKKSVVTSNKELVATKGAELLRLAKENDVNFLFEASVGGGIPIIRPLHQCLGANDIYEIAGILNGTTNFILTKMIREQMHFEDALALAQKLGYAERDPSADIDGLDACRKICILASLAFGEHVYPNEVYTEGIRQITREDVEYAANWGGAIKLIGSAKVVDGGKLDVMVAPRFVPSSQQLSSVDDVFNAILVRGDATGDVVFYGKGAGKLPTASAVVADIIDAVRANGTIGSLWWQDTGKGQVIAHENSVSAYYVRVMCGDIQAQFHISSLFGNVDYLSRMNKPVDEYAFITHALSEAEMDECVQKLAGWGFKVLGKVRIFEE